MILMFDDEKYFVTEYVDSLAKAGFEVTLCATVDEYVAVYRKSIATVQVCIIDIMAFGPGNRVGSRDTDRGLGTGMALLELLEEIEREEGVTRVPAKLVLTNRSGAVLDEIRLDPRVAGVWEKREMLPGELVEVVRRQVRVRVQ